MQMDPHLPVQAKALVLQKISENSQSCLWIKLKVGQLVEIEQQMSYSSSLFPHSVIIIVSDEKTNG